MYSYMKKSCTYSHERHVTCVWETVHDDVVLLTLSVHSQSTAHINLLLKVKRQSKDETTRPTSNLEEMAKESPQRHYGFELNSHTSNFRTSRVIICFQWRFWVSFSESLICGRTAVSRRGAANTTELWKALKSAHALSKEVWHSTPDGYLREEKQENHIGFNPSMWWNLSLKVKCAISAPLVATNKLEQLWRNLSGVCPCKKDKQRFQCVVCSC